ncbi:MAG TPA: toll/interleukin-1 receptor domain-containing protein [Longimicrobium sp.]|nr:toll/interleukin-1 receptor domain-containing protein [Longimicrobium sp.]
MYYAESAAFTERNPTLRGAITTLDREIAHAYHASGLGRVERALLRNRTGLDGLTLDDLLAGYEREGVVRVLEQWVDAAGHAHDPDEDVCAECGAARAEGVPGLTVVRVVRQPRAPAFDGVQPDNPDVFLSYRRAESGTLAADIFYLLQGHGIKVFLDRSDIPAGAHPELEYLRAASAAPNFIALVSKTYFDSLPCTFELAHAARARNRLLRVNVAPVAPTPPALVWFDQPNWVADGVTPTGLSTDLARTLLELVRLPRGQNVMDLRRDACRYLLEQKKRAELMEVLARLPWMVDFDFSGVANTKLIVNSINSETSNNNLPTLCAVLAPEA